MDPVALDTSALQMVDQVLDLAAQENGEIEAFVEPATPGFIPVAPKFAN